MRIVTILLVRALLQVSTALGEAGGGILERYHEGRYISPLWPLVVALAALVLIGGAL